MKIKVNDQVFDADEQIVMVILSEQDKKNIANMDPKATKYCVYPIDKYPVDEVRAWMKEGVG